MGLSFAKFSARALALGLTAAAIGGCRPDAGDFYSRVYPCDSTLSGGGDQCGTSENGTPLACFAASQLGATDFCAETCGPSAPASPSDATVCLASGKRLGTCHPGPPGAPASATSDCGSGLACYRTDLASDEGVCLTGQVCAVDADCAIPRPTCGSTLLGVIYPNHPPLATDHLNCVKTDCARDSSNCPAGEFCVPSRVPPQSAPLDVCLPICDGGLNCPPNYVCFKRVSGPAAPSICLPGLLGFKCTSDTDCMIGSCVETGGTFNVCSVPCASNADCAAYGSTRDAYECTVPAPGLGHYCMTGSSFGGAPCGTDADCPNDGSLCTTFSPYGTPPGSPGQGGCFIPCDAAGQCPTPGGIHHACLDYLDPPLCYPGRIGIPCHADGDCVSGLSCLPGEQFGSDGQLFRTSICSIPCASDADCGLNDTWCSDAVCVLPRPGDYLCDADKQCQSRTCAPSTRAAEIGTSVRRCTAAAVGVF